MTPVCCVGLCLLHCLLWVPVFGVTCPFKECNCSDTQINCFELRLTTMPRAVDKHNTYFKSAYFDGSRMTVVTSGSLPANLTRLSFMETPIQVIEDDAFVDSANTLNVLALSSVHFTRIPDAFLRLNALTDLTLTNCTIRDWNMNAMAHIGLTLQSYFTQHMLLTSWPPWLKSLSKLTFLGLSACSLTDIPDDGLDGSVKHLSTLILMHNNLTSIPKAVSKLVAVTSIYFDSNRISDVKWLTGNGKLKSLSLNSNRLHDANQLSLVLRPHNTTLGELDLQDNLLTSFPNLDFLTKVKNLDFTNNRLNVSNLGSLPPGLKTLDMGENSLPRIPGFLSNLPLVTELLIGHNSVTQLDGAAFPPNTQRVETDYNLITTITDTSFPHSSSITTVMLNNNPLVTISVNSLKNLPNLETLNLENTKLTRVPLALASLNKAKSINLSNTSSLVCTCSEKSLRGWIVAHHSDIVKGLCGKTNIYNFFSVLSSECP